MRASFTARIQVLDSRALKSFARGGDPDLAGSMSTEAAIVEALADPATARDSGYEITAASATRESGNAYVLSVEADIHDVGLMNAEAAESHRRAGSGDFDPGNVGDILYEHLLGSNAPPGPVGTCLEIVDHACEGMPLYSAPSP